ncbi:MAG: UvrD-helicase domain-containing protein, partial [Cyclobacteriaceae bacterium]|nr:UvrD-helicase domain-containing protein [Cyclobacteriaceae bacterium]
MGYITIYKSSAGSGKTTVLSKEYISLALKEDFRNILAVTFTNKATQELKSRIISRLYDYSCGKDDFQSDSLKSETGLNDRQFKERCKYVLNNILYNYGQFSVSTIDSFFQRIIRSFARESGIQGNYRLELDSDTVLTEAIDRLIEEAGLHKELTDWLVRFALEVADEGKNTNLSRQIKQLGEELFSESFKEIKGVLAKESSYEAMGKFQNRLREEIKEYTEKLKYFGEKALSALKKEGLEPSDLSRGIGTALLQLCAGEDPDLSKANLSKAMNDINSWGAKSSKVKNQIDRAAESGLMDSFLEYEEYFTINNSAYSTAKAILNNFNNYGLLSEILHKINEYKSENDIMLISDSNEFLKEITGGYESPFIYEKTGNRYDHFLIDEFQDTSAFQWANFYPLIENSVSQGYKNFIVGDVKQSIYRWRGGDLNLLNSGVELQFTDVINEPLITNYRSGYHIIEFNNHCFSSILPRVKETRLDTLMDSVEEDLKNKIELQFESAYLDISQEKPKSLDNTSGYVELNYCGGKTKSDYESSAMERLVGVVEKVQEKGVEAKDIAVLVRKRSEGEAVAKYLLKYSKSEKAKENVVYDIVSGDSLLLKNSKAVLFIVSVLRWIKAPDDKISLAAFASEFDGNSEVDKYNHLVFSKINEWISEFNINKETNRFTGFFQG